jgi:hypothetical protein
MTFGLPRLLGELRTLGIGAEELEASDGTKFVVVRHFSVPGGRFVDRIIQLGIQATPDYPISVASAIHVCATPQLYTIGDNVPGVRNIANSVLGPEWAYWSHNFGWAGKHDARRLISQINGIFLRAA